MQSDADHAESANTHAICSNIDLISQLPADSVGISTQWMSSGSNVYVKNPHTGKFVKLCCTCSDKLKYIPEETIELDEGNQANDHGNNIADQMGLLQKTVEPNDGNGRPSKPAKDSSEGMVEIDRTQSQDFVISNKTVEDAQPDLISDILQETAEPIFEAHPPNQVDDFPKEAIDVEVTQPQDLITEGNSRTMETAEEPQSEDLNSDIPRESTGLNDEVTQQSQSQPADPDEEAKRQFGSTNFEVVVSEIGFDKLISEDINQRKMKGRKRKTRRDDDELNSDEDLDAQCANAERILRMGNQTKKRKLGKEPIEKDVMEVDGEEESDEEEEKDDRDYNDGRGASSSRISPHQRTSKNISKKSKKPLSAKQLNIDTEDSGDGLWLSKESSGDKSKIENVELERKEEAASLSDTSEESEGSSSVPEPPKLTRLQYKRDKELQKLLREAKSLDDDDDDEEEAEGEQETGRKGRKTAKKGGRVIVDTEEEDNLSTDGFDVMTLGESSAKKSKAKEKPKMVAKKKHKGKVGPTKKEPTKRRRQNRYVFSDEEDLGKEEEGQMDEMEDEDANKINEERKSVERGKKKKKLAFETKEAERAEKERRKRLEERQKKFNGIELVTNDEGETTLGYAAGQNPVTQLKNVILDNDRESEEPDPVRVHPSLVRVLKKHQAEGIQFIYNCTIESVSRLDKEGGGCILGHCMGLGKTLQIIAFLHTILTYQKISKKIAKVLIVVPKNVILNWMAEFDKWLYHNDKETDVINYSELDSWKSHDERLAAVERWINYDGPSVLIIGYEMYRNLTLIEEDKEHLPVAKRKKEQPQKKKKKALSVNERRLEKLKPKFRKYLHEGPDIVICDEGHKLKSTTTALFCTFRHIKTKRRICLTGTPLQNNLEEYYCMVDFVKPNLLGSLEEYKNRFSNIINKGRSKDASGYEVTCMKRRCHVLFEKLKGILDRRDYSILKDSLPSKQDYVIYVRLTMHQEDMYRKCLEFLETRTVTGHIDHFGVWQSGKGIKLIQDHHILYRIWTHPYLLVEHEKREALKKLFQEDDDFVVPDEETEMSDDAGSDLLEEDAAPSTSNAPPKSKGRPKTRKQLKESAADLAIGQSASDETTLQERETETPPEVKEWAAGLISEADQNRFEISNKLMLLVEIIKKCETIGDKLLVFSQYLDSIALIQRMLSYMVQNDQWFSDDHEALMAQGEEWGWERGIDYDVIDGSVSSICRDRIQTDFNDPLKLRNRLLLISTRAGSLGTNLVGANRVVIFDCTWNPSHDTQSLFRVYRFGQLKPVYIYRFVAQGTMEERIYNRQVTKESMAKRVTQSAQIQRHYTIQELDVMYEFNPAPRPDPSDNQGPHLDPPKDRLLGDIILKGTEAIVNYHTHDLLFDELENEKLTDEEREQAWSEYNDERQGHRNQPPPVPLPTDPQQPQSSFSVASDLLYQQQQQAMLLHQLNQLQPQQQQQQQRVNINPIIQQLQHALQISLHKTAAIAQQARMRQQQQQRTTMTQQRAGNPNGIPCQLVQEQADFERTMKSLYNAYRSDQFHLMCYKVREMTPDMAMKLYQIKQFLCYFVHKIPKNFVGSLDNAEKFNRYFLDILQDALTNNHDKQWIYEKALMTLATTIVLVRNVPDCVLGINYVTREFPDVKNVRVNPILNGEQ